MNKLLVFVGITVLLIGFIGTAESYSFHKNITFNKEINISIDNNIVSITSGSFSWSRVCGSSYSTTLEVPLSVDVNEDYCPTLNEVYTPLLNAYQQCDANAIAELKQAKKDLNDMLSRVDYNALKTLLQKYGNDQNKMIHGYLTANDTLMSNKFNDWWAKIEKTLMPSQATLRTLEVQRNECEKLRKTCVADLNNMKFQTMMLRSDIIPSKDEQIRFWQTISYILILLVLLIVAYEIGLFERFFEKV